MNHAIDIIIVAITGFAVTQQRLHHELRLNLTHFYRAKWSVVTTMVEKIGSFVIDIEGKTLSPLECELVAHPLVGGVILFARNYESREQLKVLCQALRSSRKNPLLIMVDQEGGRVQRFINEFTRLPNMALIGKLYDRNPKQAYDLARDCGWLMAIELLSVGVDLSLGPVLDLNKGINHAIGDRAFHADPEIVTNLTAAFMQGMRLAGMAATAKHFPGHGSISTDSHAAIPIDERSLSEIEQSDLVPFIKSIKTGITAIMAAHIVFPKIDHLPVGFSHVWLNDILRTRFGFVGTVFSDDLNMEGANISANYSDRFDAARKAGCDFVLLCNNRQGVIQVLENLSYSSHQLSAEKWSILRGNLSHMQMPLKENPKWLNMRELLQNLMMSPDKEKC